MAETSAAPPSPSPRPSAVEPTPAVGPAETPTPLPLPPRAAGLGICHYTPDGAPPEFGWAYETTLGRGLFWREVEPQPGQFDFSLLDAFIGQRVGKGMTIWLAFQTVGADVQSGAPKVPIWLFEQGALWHTGTCDDSGGLFAPWDPVYIERLGLLLRAINDHLAEQDQAYQETIGGIVMMSGGMYGETQLHSCGMSAHLRSAYGLGQADLEQRFLAAAQGLVDLYAQSFPDRPIMLQLGWPAVDEALLDHAVRTASDRLYIKWNGLDPDNVGNGQDAVRRDNNELYTALFGSLPAGVHAGFEVGHPDLLQGEDGQWSEERLGNLMEWALRGRAHFLCLQSPAWQGLLTAPGWQQLDAELEANAGLTREMAP